MKLDLSHFKKTHEDKATATLLHPQGHTIKIAKSSLSKQMKAQLAKLPMYADGGDVEDADAAGSSDAQVSQTMGDAQPPQAEQLQSTQGVAQPTQDNYGPTPDAPVAQDLPQSMGRAPAAVGAALPASPVGNDGSDGGLANAIGQEKRGLNKEAATQGKIADEQAQIIHNRVSQQQQVLDHFQNEWGKINSEYQAALKDYKDGHIDPEHYVSDKSTLGKVSTAIGLILGGIGGGLTHQENPALKFLNANIDRDIESQKAELGKKANLVTAYYHQFGNLKDATDMARIVQSGIVADQLKEAALKNGSDLAQANADKAIGALYAQNAPVLQNLAFRRGALSAAANGSIDPAQLVPHLVPKEHQKDVFKEIGNAQNAVQNGDKIMKHFDQAAKENTLLRTGAGLLRIPAAISSMRALMLPIIHDAEGKVSEFEGETTKALEPKPGDTDAKIAEKRQALLEFINGKKQAPTARAYGINLNNYRSTSSSPETRLNPQQQQWVSWAKQNPNDPRSSAVLKKLGLSQ